jgi:NADPH:quinone reductase-like Zn-dependent oxidoreductase
MKSYWMQSDGQTSVIELRDIEIPEPGPDQVVNSSKGCRFKPWRIYFRSRFA